MHRICAVCRCLADFIQFNLELKKMEKKKEDINEMEKGGFIKSKKRN